jgi:hypothetical protein
MKDNKYFSTGEFARLANISKQTLIFYDKKGIFSPEYKDKNNFSINILHILIHTI